MLGLFQVPNKPSSRTGWSTDILEQEREEAGNSVGNLRAAGKKKKKKKKKKIPRPENWAGRKRSWLSNRDGAVRPHKRDDLCSSVASAGRSRCGRRAAGGGRGRAQDRLVPCGDRAGGVPRRAERKTSSSMWRGSMRGAACWPSARARDRRDRHERKDAVTFAKRLIEQDQVDAIIGGIITAESNGGGQAGRGGRSRRSSRWPAPRRSWSRSEMGVQEPAPRSMAVGKVYEDMRKESIARSA